GINRAWYICGVLTVLSVLTVSIDAYGRELSRVALAAVDRDRLARAPDRDLGCEDLGHGGLAHDRAALVLPVGRAKGEEPGRFHLGREVGQHALEPLEAREGLAEGLALPGVADRLVEGTLGEADGHRGHGDPAPLEHSLAVPEAPALLTEQVRLRHPNALQDQLGRVGGMEAELLVALAGPEAGHPPLQDEG